jgi:cysteinyl-tRNA synthetase
MHNGFLNIDNEKMSKSLGNFFTIRDVLERFDGETVRFFMLRTHYRSPFNFSGGNLEDARQALRRLYTALLDSPVDSPAIDWEQPQAAAFRAAMDDDFNTPGALAVLFELASEINRRRASGQPAADGAALLRALGGVLGVLQQDARTYLQGGAAGGDAARIEALVAERAAAKKQRDFARADALRQQLAAEGIEVQDSAQGTTWVRA